MGIKVQIDNRGLTQTKTANPATPSFIEIYGEPISGGSGDAVPLNAPTRIVTADSITLLESDLGGVVVCIDNGNAKTFTLPTSFPIGSRVRIHFISFGGGPSNAIMTLTGTTTVIAPVSTLRVNNAIDIIKIAEDPFHVWVGLPYLPSSSATYANTGRWTPTFLEGTNVSAQGNWFFNRVGKASNNGSSGSGDLITISGVVQCVIDPGDPVVFEFTGFPPLGNVDIVAVHSVFWPVGADQVPLVWTGRNQTEDTSIRVSSEDDSTSGATITISFTVTYEALAAA